ncbi:CDP-archaeol synthase [Candidatus Woesearchaeota archaeon]|nr:CDP-archaeol synthase [Candidatus Woesearchaeota archaeon]
MNVALAFYIMIPAYLANMSPALLGRFFPRVSMDFGLSFGKKRLLGANKTWGGFLSGVVVAVLAGFVLSRIYWPFEFSAVYWSFLIGIGALVGDAVKSFFKRRVDIKPGRSWIPFDQIDFTVGALLFGSFVFFPGWFYAVLVVVVSAVGHILVNHLGFYLNIQKNKW